MLRRDRIIAWVMAVLCAICLVGVAITVVMLFRNDEENYTFDIDIDGEKEVLEFTGLGLTPGEQKTYTVALRGKLDYASTITFDFSADQPQPLAEFVYARVVVDGRMLCDELLSSLLAESRTVLKCQLPKGELREVEIIYYMPIETGNEAKLREASFEITVTSSHGWED